LTPKIRRALAPLAVSIVLPVKVLAVLTPIKVSVDVGSVKVPVLIIVEIVGVVIVGEVLITNVLPVPVCEATEVALPTEVIGPVRLALVVTFPAVNPAAVPVRLVATPDAGVPNAGVTKVGEVIVGEVDATTLPVPVVPLSVTPFKTKVGVVTLVVKEGLFKVETVAGVVPVITMLFPPVNLVDSSDQPIAKSVLLVLDKICPVVPPTGTVDIVPPPMKEFKSCNLRGDPTVAGTGRLRI